MKKIFLENKGWISAFLLLFAGYIANASANDDPCLSVSKVKIVVIGADADHEKNANDELLWVSKYRSYLKSFNTDNEVVNLTADHLNSYHIMPTGSSSPYGRPQSNPKFNISKAISMQPDAILINLESDGVLNNYHYNEQIVNIMLLCNKANKNNIPVWINTPKPTKFDSAYYSETHHKMKDLIKERFGPFVVDFWEELATYEGGIKADYATNDGLYINAQGQEIILEKLIKADIHQYCARRKFKGSKDVALYSLKALKENASDNHKKFEVTLANSGSEIKEPVPVILSALNTKTKKTYTLNETLAQGLNECQFKSLSFTFNDLPKGNYKISAYINKRIDRNAENDTTHLEIEYLAFHDEDLENSKGIQVDSKVELYAINIDGFSSNFNKTNKTEGFIFSNSSEVKVYHIDNLTDDKTAVAGTFNIVAEKVVQINGFEISVDDSEINQIEIYTKRNLNIEKDTSLEGWRLIGSTEITDKRGKTQIEVSTEDIRLDRKDSITIYIRARNLSKPSFSLNK